MARHFKYYDGRWRTNSFSCPDCGWIGETKSMARAIRKLMIGLSCPDCEKTLLILSYPTPEETREAAAEGNVEAISELERIVRS